MMGSRGSYRCARTGRTSAPRPDEAGAIHPDEAGAIHMSRVTKDDLGGRPVRIPIGPATLEGDLEIPEGARAVVLFAHGSGSSRHSLRNRYVARVLRDAGLATLLLDLLTGDEEAVDMETGLLRFDIGLLAGRVVGATDWLDRYDRADRVGYIRGYSQRLAAIRTPNELPRMLVLDSALLPALACDVDHRRTRPSEVDHATRLGTSRRFATEE
jgi:hypothetical protein